MARAAPWIAANVPDGRLVAYGHVGDGNLHFNVSAHRGPMRRASWRAAQPCKRAVHDLVQEFGGSFSAEHGIGRLKVGELERYTSPVELSLMRAIKQAFDPHHIMNPGKVLSDNVGAAHEAALDRPLPPCCCSLLSACGQRASAPPAAAVPAAGAAPAGEAGEGPRLALSPDNVHIEYRVLGHGEPAVLLVHGWACDANYWNEQLEALKAHYTVVAINLAGHGGSGNNRSDWSIANYAADVAAVARSSRTSAWCWSGTRWGPPWSLAAAPLIGERVIGIIAVDALRSVGQPPLSAARHRAARGAVPGRLRRRDAQARHRLAVRARREPGAGAEGRLRHVARATGGGRGLAAGAVVGGPRTALLPDIHVPVYAINSDLLPTDDARIRKSLPDFTLDVLDHSGHFLMLEAPARFNPLLLKDIAALAARAGSLSELV